MSQDDPYELPRLAEGRMKVDEVYWSGGSRQIMLARKGKTWYAMNHSSENPCNLRNCRLRAAWAHAQGLKVKDVENYVRRKKREREAEYKRDALTDAIKLLEANSFTVMVPANFKASENTL